MVRDRSFNLDAEKKVLEFIRDDMPSDLKALLHTWAHKPASSWIQLNRFEIESRALCAGEDILAGTNIGDELEPGRAICIGTFSSSLPLMATWHEGSKAMWLVSIDSEYGKINHVGTIDDLAKEEIQLIKDEGRKLRDLDDDLPRLNKLSREFKKASSKVKS